jgi:transposase
MIMEVLYQSCCGVDVHKKFLVACLLVTEESGQVCKEIRRFSTMTGDLLACIDWLRQAHCRAIAMESTGVYWQSPYNLMEGRFEQVMIVNAQHLKRVPGHKTDKKDAEWIAELLQIGLLKPSFIPTRPQRELRHLTRLRTTMIQERTRLINRLQKVLEDANLKLSSALSDVMGQTSRQILFALLGGEEDPVVLANLALRHAPKKRELLEQALRGLVSDHHRLLLRELLELIDRHEQAIMRLDQNIAERLKPLEEKIERLDAIPGLNRRSIEVLFAEVGWEMSPFPDAAHLASLIGICPGNYETGGKRLKGRICKGNRWAKSILVQAAHAAALTQTYLGAQYRRLATRRGSKRAAVAVGHSILVIYYHMLKTGQPYQEKGVDYFTHMDRHKTEQQLTKQLERLGYQVTLTPAQNA